MKCYLTKILLFVFICLLAFNAFGRHKYHTSFTRIDYNPEENLLEVSVRVFAHDLIPALEKRQKKKVDLELTKDIDKIIENYLAEKLVLKTKSGETKKFKWLGKELETDVIYLYVELPFEGELDEAELKNTLFFEKFSEQVNLVTINFEGQKADLVFKRGDEFKKIEKNINVKN